MKGAMIILGHLEIVVTNCVVSASLWTCGSYQILEYADDRGEGRTWSLPASLLMHSFLSSLFPVQELQSFSKAITLPNSIPKSGRKTVCLTELEEVSWGQWSFIEPYLEGLKKRSAFLRFLFFFLIFSWKGNLHWDLSQLTAVENIIHRTKREEEPVGGDTSKYWDRPIIWLNWIVKGRV